MVSNPLLLFMSFGNLILITSFLYIFLGLSIFYMDKINTRHFRLLFMKNLSLFESLLKMKLPLYKFLFLGLAIASFFTYLLSKLLNFTISIKILLLLSLIHLLIQFIFDLRSLASINKRLKNEDMEWFI